MEVTEAGKIAIARPVASRPRCPISKSFSELLAGAINDSSTNICSEMAVTAIRPKTVRLKPPVNHALAGKISSQVGTPGASAGPPSENTLQPAEKPNVLYKPMAKLASRKNFSLHVDQGSSTSSQIQEAAEPESRVLPTSDGNHQFDPRPEFQRSLLAKPGQQKTIEHSTIISENTDEVEQSLLNASNVDRSTFDGYNWRKYGQKQVKGSEYPRSYYKCTHPKCPVKKKVERSFDGQIAEIAYRGDHNHAKPQPLKRNFSDELGQGVVCTDTSKETNNPTWSNQYPPRNEAYMCMEENHQNDVGLSMHSAYSSKVQPLYGPISAVTLNNAVKTPQNFVGLSGEGSKRLEVECDEPRSKRRKSESRTNEAGTSGESALPYMSVPNTTDSEITEDGFRWRKYGQKVVKGNTNPRSYYRCTSPKCSVRKYVERTMDDPTAFVTTYEGKHNHVVPNRRSNPEASKTSTKSSSLKINS